jgi:ParB family transcriptional regulator, chromosome partitioning protein
MEDKTMDSSGLYEKGKLYHLSLNVILADPNQPRKVMEAQALDELASSIGKHGILEPILFRRNEDGSLIVVAGERRIAAARKAGLNAVPAIYVDGNCSEIALVENLLRQDLTAVEEAEALQRLMDQQKYTHEQLSGVIGKARTTISDILLINRLPLEIRDDCRGNRLISKKILIEISRKKQERAMLTAYYDYKNKLQQVKRTRRKKSDAASADGFESLAVMIDRILTRLNDGQMNDREDENPDNFRNTLERLRDRINAFLSGPLRQLQNVKTGNKESD